MKEKENAVTAEEILLDHVNVYNGMIESVPIQIINAMIKYSASQNADLVKERNVFQKQLCEKEKENRVLKDQNNDFIIALNDYSDEVNKLKLIIQDRDFTKLEEDLKIFIAECAETSHLSLDRINELENQLSEKETEIEQHKSTIEKHVDLLFESQSKANKLAEVLKTINNLGGLGYNKHDYINKALAEFKG